MKIPNIQLPFSFFKRLPDNSRNIILSAMYAVAASLSAVAFLFLTNSLFNLTFVNFSKHGTIYFLLASFAVIMGTSLIVGVLLRFLSPEASGSGVPRLKAAYWKDLGFISWRTVWVKFIAGILSLGGGTSLGREGPSVFVGAGIASNLAGVTGTIKQGRRPASVAGGAAALAAAFNTPLAAIAFVMEELLGEFNSRVMGGVLLAAVVGALIVHAILGAQPAFSLPIVSGESLLMYLVVPVVAVAASFIGVIFQRLTIVLRARARKLKRVPHLLRPSIAGLITWILGGAVFIVTGHIGIFGLGYNDLSSALAGTLPWQFAGLLVLAKLPATVISYGLDGCGGIFSPTLFFGGLTGVFITGIAGIWLPLTPADGVVLAAVGMSACFNAVVRAPLTSVLIVFEMTHQFAFVPALLICILISQAISRLGNRHNFYDSLLLQDGHELIRIKPPRDIVSWQKLAVSEIAKTKPVIITDLSRRNLRKMLEEYPYKRFPVVSPKRVRGIATRREIEASLAENRAPKLEAAVFCRPDTNVRKVGDLLMKSLSGIVLVGSGNKHAIQAIVTLHDLLRAQAAIAE